jgi:YggT family protein
MMRDSDGTRGRGRAAAVRRAGRNPIPREDASSGPVAEPTRRAGADDVEELDGTDGPDTSELIGRRNAPRLEPHDVAVERRAGADRRVAEQPVEVERRVGARRGEKDREAARERRGYIVARVTQGVDYLFLLLYGLLGIRFVLALLGASQQAGFVQFINGLTDPFYAPFANIVARPSVNGGFMDFPLIIALLAYMLLHMATRGLLRLIAGRNVA